MPADVFSPVAALIGVASWFAFVNERLVEALIAPLYERGGLSEYTWTLRFVAIFTAIGISGYLFPIDLITPVLEQFDVVPRIPEAGAWLTAISIGLGSNGFHDLLFGKNAN